MNHAIKTLAALSLTVVSSLSFAAGFNNGEKMCLLMGSMADSTMGFIRAGGSEKEFLERISVNRPPVVTKVNKEVIRVTETVIQYVYTMGYTPEVSRRMVYLKCKAGDFN